MTQLLYTPNVLQREFHFDAHRFRVLDCGRRWGKSLCGMVEAYRMLVQSQGAKSGHGRVWVVAPTFDLVQENWRLGEEWLRNLIGRKRLTDMAFDFPGLGEIELKSADAGDERLRGAGLDAAVLDEASRIPETAWTYGVRPALADREGRAVFISTPKGRNWFFRLFQQGQLAGSWKSWKWPSHARPNFPQAEWLEIERTTPELILKQEYLAEFLEDEGVVFQGLSRCLRGELSLAREGCDYVLGVDLARAEDFTVIVVLDRCHHKLVAIERLRELDWSIQRKLIQMMAMKYSPAGNTCRILVDSSGVGDPIEEDLRKAGLSVRGFKFTNQSKQNLVEELMVAIEQGLIGIPNVPDTAFLLDELRAFTYEQLPSGRIRYSAPSGLHDDGVIALGLALYEMRGELNRPPAPDYKEADVTKPQPLTFKEYHEMSEDVNKYLEAFPEWDGVADGRLLAAFARSSVV